MEQILLSIILISYMLSPIVIIVLMSFYLNKIRGEIEKKMIFDISQNILEPDLNRENEWAILEIVHLILVFGLLVSIVRLTDMYVEFFSDADVDEIYKYAINGAIAGMIFILTIKNKIELWNRINLTNKGFNILINHMGHGQLISVGNMANILDISPIGVLKFLSKLMQHTSDLLAFEPDTMIITKNRIETEEELIFSQSLVDSKNRLTQIFNVF
ncbi:MAG: hypothetical protein INQ03_15465 [Candidatus Heimdallarchaeota archaeon]|nr:hypothetical protein [Candidatus Heimdallarchaeota archaeon]